MSRNEMPTMGLRPAAPTDRARLVSILAEPEVARWWGTHDPRAAEAQLHDAGGNTWVVEIDGEVAGLILIDEEADPNYRHARLDIALSAAHHGRGDGRRALTRAIQYLISTQRHHRITIDPRADNKRAISTYSSLGFRQVGVMRSYERDGQGRWHDAVLMELLAENWTGGA